jgi:four helix bundle suffix protein
MCGPHFCSMKITQDVRQANYLLDRQIKRLERDFVEKGGLRERMTRARLTHRNRGGPN